MASNVSVDFDPAKQYGWLGANVLIAPHKYVQMPGLMSQMGPFLSELGGPGTTAGVVISESGQNRHSAQIRSSLASIGVEAKFVTFHKYCTWQEIHRVSSVQYSQLHLGMPPASKELS